MGGVRGRKVAVNQPMHSASAALIRGRGGRKEGKGGERRRKRGENTLYSTVFVKNFRGLRPLAPPHLPGGDPPDPPLGLRPRY